MIITREQTKAARTWLGWNQSQLAVRANVSLSTITDYESGKRRPIPNTMKAIKAALEEAGIEFTEDSIRQLRKSKAK